MQLHGYGLNVTQSLYFLYGHKIPGIAQKSCLLPFLNQTQRHLSVEALGRKSIL